MKIKYSEGCILDLFHKIKSGVPWNKITKQLNKKYNLVNDHTHYRNLYHRNKERFEKGDDEKLTLEMIRHASSARKSNALNSKKLSAVLKQWDVRDLLLSDFDKLLSKYSQQRTVVKKAKRNSLKGGNADMTQVLDISDIHAGLKTIDYDYDVIRRRLKYLVNVFLEEYDRNSKTHNVTDFVVAFNGDMIHNDKLHEDSVKACEEGNPGQMFSVAEILFDEVIEPIALVNLPTRIVGTAGNHDRTAKGRCMFQQGREGFTWTIYKSLEMITKRLKYNNLSYIIPEGYGVVVEIQGSNILYEHGDMCSGQTEKALTDHMYKRAAQLHTVLHGMRIGHYHEFKQLGRKIIVNGSTTSGDDYSESLGYDTEPVQTIVTYCKSPYRENSLYRVFPVLLPK